MCVRVRACFCLSLSLSLSLCVCVCVCVCSYVCVCVCEGNLWEAKLVIHVVHTYALALARTHAPCLMCMHPRRRIRLWLDGDGQRPLQLQPRDS